jgi:magnesium transporter
LLQSLYRTSGGELKHDILVAEYSAALADEEGLLWVDMAGTPHEEAQAILADQFHFHPLAIEDTIQDIHGPKLDDYEKYLYTVLHAARVNPIDGDTATIELDLFLGPNYVVSYRHEPISAVEDLWQHASQDSRHMSQGADRLLVDLVSGLADAYLPVIDALTDAIDNLEDEVLDRASPATLQRIYDLKRAVSRLRRIMSPQREVVNRLSRDEISVIRPKVRIYFRDAFDHLVRLADILDSTRDILSGTLDIYLSATSNRLNEVMKVLTIVTTILMPMTLVASLYGMNFRVLPGAPLTGGFWGVIAACVVTGAVMTWWFRRRRWL